MKKVLVFEPRVGGHHTDYVEALCAGLTEIPELRGTDAVFVVSPRMLEDERIARYLGAVRFDTEIPAYVSAPGFSLRHLGSYLQDLSRLWAIYADAVRRHEPQHVILPTADHLSQAALASRGTRQVARTTALLHQSRATATDAKSHAKRVAYSRIWAFSPWDRLLLVNPQTFLEGREKFRTDPRLGLAPHPVARIDLVDRRDARQRLGLPADRTHVGLIGSIGVRVDLAAILGAFEAAGFGADTCLLIAGKPSSEAKREMILEAMGRSGDESSIEFRDTYLSTEELHLYYRACDVVLPYYSDTTGLSANLLLAAAANTPALVADHGFGQWLVNRFPHIGAAESRAPDRMAEALRALVRRSAQHPPPPKDVEDLLAFHSTENFVRAVFGLEAQAYPS